MGIKELLNAVAEPRNRFGGQVWANNWTEMVTNCHKCIEHRKPNRESMISSVQFQKDHGKFPEPTCSVLTEDIPLGGGLLLALHRSINTVGVPESK